MRKKANILISDVIFIVLLVVFISIMFIFVSKQSSNALLYEERTAKEIALAIDTAKSGTQITLNIDDILNRNEGIQDPIRIVDNTVSVKLTSKTGYSYSFFNDVRPNIEIQGGYVIINVNE